VRILVTGGLGYLGGRISQFLVSQGHDVVVTTRQKELPRPEWLNGNSCLYYLDLESPDLSDLGQVDYVVHLAALNEVECAKSPERAIQINTIGTMRLIHALKSLNVQRFLYFSTAHVYRVPLEGLIDETNLARPVHPYAYSHRAAEDLVFAFQGHYFDRGIVVRLSNGFGFPERPEVNRWTLLVNDICRQAAQSGQIRLVSDGLQLRDFIALEDVAGATVHLLGLPDSRLDNGIFNVGSGRSMSVFEMASLVHDLACEVYGYQLPPIVRPPFSHSPPSGPQELTYSVKKLEMTGYSCRSDWRHEIQETLRLCRQNFPLGLP